MKELPKKIIRLDDGMEFILNPTSNKYRVHLGIPHLDDPNHYHHEYTYERLMTGDNEGAFKVADGTEDIEGMKKRWMEKTKKEMEGHD